jgi:Mg-chelatase subunit ChlD/uncharacterized membrane protein
MWSDWLHGKATLLFTAPGRLWWIVALAAVVIIAAVAAGRRSGRIYLATVLRIAALALLGASLAGLSLETQEESQGLCIVVATDVSASVGAAGERAAAELVRQLAPKLRPNDALGAVAFARHAEIRAWPASPPRQDAVGAIGDTKLDPSATRVAAGIESALPLCPEEREKKIVLVTDGNETFGDARRAAVLAAETGVRIFAQVPSATLGDGMVLDKLVAPPLVRQGSVFPLRAMVRSSFPEAKSGTLDILIDGSVASHGTVRLDPGMNVFEVPYQLHEAGTVQVAAGLRADGSMSEDHRETSIAVAGPIRALVVGHDRNSALAKALQLREVEIDFREPAAFPKLDDLLQYHCVIFDDVPRKELSDASLDALETYVKTFGGGFLMAGGPRSFGDKAFQKSAVERVLPVAFVEQPPKAKGRSAMGVFLVIDRSNSMGYNSRRHDIRDGEKMRYAREAALAMISQLRNEDRLGVIAFDSDPYVLGALKPLSEQRDVLTDRVSRLVPGGGTDFKAALEIATAQLAQSGLKTLHVILLTDGDSNRGASDHDAVLAAMARLGISVTTIRIGDDDVNLEFLQRISKQTGGRFYHVEDIEVLPQLIISDTKQAKGDKEGAEAESAEKREEGPAGPLKVDVGEPTEVRRGLAGREFPTLASIPPSRLKPGADLVLYATDRGEKQPFLATWQYGLGRTAALAFDPSLPDARVWTAWPGFAKLWSQLVRWAIREEAPWETRQSVRYRDGNPFLEVQTFDDVGQASVTAQVFTAPEHSVELSLTAVAPRVYRAPLPPLAPGKYALLLTRKSGEQPAVQKRDMLSVEASADESTNAELARKVPDMDLLREVSATTGGSVNPTTDELAAHHGARRAKLHPLDLWLIPLALAFLVADIAIRLRAAR